MTDESMKDQTSIQMAVDEVRDEFEKAINKSHTKLQIN